MTPEEQVFVFAPTGRDALLACTFLNDAGIPAVACDSIEQLTAAIAAHPGAVVLGEEALTPQALPHLEQRLDAQPPWSDLPLIVLAGRDFSTSPLRPLNVLGPLRNVMILERPVRRLIFNRAVEVAMRSRRRQFQMRAYLKTRADLLAREQELNRLKDEFLMTVSHELRTPLTAIVGWARMLATGEIRDSQRARALEIIERSASAQAQIVSDLLDVSRAISGKTRLNVQTVDVSAVVSAATDILFPAASAKQIRIHSQLRESTTVMGDPERLQQVVWNLLSNGIKFTPRGGDVHVQIDDLQDSVAITISDNGSGIAPEFLPYAFDSFRQGDAGTTRQIGGLGLGLAIVRQLVELHGGTVSAESGGVGQGATFRVVLPASGPPDTAAESRATAAAPNPDPRLDGRRVLVIDDDADTRELFLAILERAGASVRVAESVGEGVSAAREFEPDVVLSDIEMPLVNGYSLIPLLQEACGRAPAAVAVTAHARAEDRLRALQAGFTGHVAKPVSPRDLISAVETALSR